MAIVLAIIISLAVYLGGGWCAYNIYESFQDIDTMTIQGLYSSQILTYNLVALAFNILFGWLAEKRGEQYSEKFIWIAIGVPLATWAVCAYILPLSYGASILNTIINIIVLIYSATVWLNREL